MRPLPADGRGLGVGGCAESACGFAAFGGVDFVEDAAERGVVGLEGQVQKARAAAEVVEAYVVFDLFERGFGAGAGGPDGGLGHRVLGHVEVGAGFAEDVDASRRSWRYPYR